MSALAIRMKMSLVISVLVSIITSNITANKLMLFLNSTSFESTDPIFNNDIGYYLFQKPFLEYIVWFGIITLVALTIYMGIYYVIALNTQFDGVRSETLKKSKIVKQLLFNANNNNHCNSVSGYSDASPPPIK